MSVNAAEESQGEETTPDVEELEETPEAPAPEEIDDKVDDANNAAENAQVAADNAEKEANELLSAIRESSNIMREVADNVKELHGLLSELSVEEEAISPPPVIQEIEHSEGSESKNGGTVHKSRRSSASPIRSRRRK